MTLSSVLSRLLPPRVIRWFAGLAAPPAPRAVRTPYPSGRRNSAWRPEPPAPTAAVSCACWGRGRSLRLRAETPASDWSFLKKTTWTFRHTVLSHFLLPADNEGSGYAWSFTSSVSGEVQQQDVGAEVAQVVEGFQMLLKSHVWQF